MSLESKIDDIRETVYEMRPVIARLDENMKSVELRLGFVERNNTRTDERLINIERKDTDEGEGLFSKAKNLFELFVSIPAIAHFIAYVVMFVSAVAAFAFEYLKTHHERPS